MGGQVRLILLGRDSRRDHRGAVAVAHVVLHDKYGAHAALLAANDRAQVGVKYLAALYFLVLQSKTSLREKLPACRQE